MRGWRGAIGAVAAAVAAGAAAVPAAGALPRDMGGALAVVPGTPPCLTLDPPCDPDATSDQFPWLAIAPDGRQAYAASPSADTLGLVPRDPATGALGQIAGCVSLTGTGGRCGVGRALAAIGDPVVSPDGHNVYVPSFIAEEPEPPPGRPPGRPAKSSVAVFARDLGTGALTQLDGAAGCLSRDGGDDRGGHTCQAVPELHGSGELTVSPDGRNVYVTASRTNSILAFARAADGSLTRLPGERGCVGRTPEPGRCSSARAVDTPVMLAVSADGRNLYAASFGHGERREVQGGFVPYQAGGGVAAFRRDEATGALTQLDGEHGCVTAHPPGDGCTAAKDLGDPVELALAPDDGHLYVVGSGAVTALTRGGDGGLTPGGCVAGYEDPCASAPLQLNEGMAVSRDGRWLYVGGQGEDDEQVDIQAVGLARPERPAGAACMLAAGPFALDHFPSQTCFGGASLGGLRALTTRSDDTLTSTGLGRVTVLAPGLVASGPARVATDGRVSLRVGCTAAAHCSGAVELEGEEVLPSFGGERGGTPAFRMARAKVSVPAGAVRRVELRLGRRGARFVEARRRIDVVARAVTRPAALVAESDVALATPRGGFDVRLTGGAGRCRPKGSEPIASAGRARLFRKLVEIDEDGPILHVHGCLTSTGRAFPLEAWDTFLNGTFFEHPYALAGPYVAFGLRDTFAEGTESENNLFVAVVDLRNGRFVRRVCALPDCYSPLSDMAASRRGGVAWISERRVYKLDAGARRPVRLDGGRDVRPESLVLRGTRLSWRKGGERRTGRLR